MWNDMNKLYDDIHLKEFPELLRRLCLEGITFDLTGHFGGLCMTIPSREAFSKGEKTALSVICHNGSYGHEKGLIEIWAPGLNDGVEGWLTAEDAFEYIKDTLNGISRHSYG